MVERRFVDFGSNLTGKLYLAEKDVTVGSGAEIQVTIKDYGVSGGERSFEKKNYQGSNYSIVQKPSTLRELKMTVDSDKNAYYFLELLNGHATGSAPGYITGEGVQYYYRLIYEVETYNAFTGYTEVRRWTWVDAQASGTDISFPAEDAVNFSITLNCGLPNERFDFTANKTANPLPAIGNYTS